MKYVVIKIIKPENVNIVDTSINKVILKDSNGSEIECEVSDVKLVENDIVEGSWIFFDMHEEIHKE